MITLLITMSEIFLSPEERLCCVQYVYLLVDEKKPLVMEAPGASVVTAGWHWSPQERIHLGPGGCGARAMFVPS